MTDTPATPSTPSTPAIVTDTTTVANLRFNQLFGKDGKQHKQLNLRVPDLQLQDVPTTYYRYFCSQVRCELRLAFQATAIRIQIILPTGTRKNFYFRYETKLSFVVSELMKFANYGVTK